MADGDAGAGAGARARAGSDSGEGARVASKREREESSAGVAGVGAGVDAGVDAGTGEPPAKKVAEGTTRVGSEGDRANLTPTRPPVGTRLEVLWELHDDGVGGGTEARPSVRHVWWSCRVDAHDGYGAACETGVEGPVGARAHLLYDAMHGFAQERLLVTFLDEDTLQDESSGARLRWRREGEAFVLEAAVGVDGGTTTLAEVVEAQNAADAEAGVGLEEAATEAMGTLPHVAQVRMAMAYRDMSDFVKARLKKLVDERGAGAEVSADDIQALVHEYQERIAS